jgi:hypothetical protein
MIPSSINEIKIICLASTISDLQGKDRITDQSIWDAVKLNNRTMLKDRSEMAHITW